MKKILKGTRRSALVWVYERKVVTAAVNEFNLEKLCWPGPRYLFSRVSQLSAFKIPFIDFKSVIVYGTTYGETYDPIVVAQVGKSYREGFTKRASLKSIPRCIVLHQDLSSSEVDHEGDKAVVLWRDVIDKEAVSSPDTACMMLLSYYLESEAIALKVWTIKSYSGHLWDSKAHCAAVKPQNLQEKRQGWTGDSPFVKDGLLLHGYSRPDINLGGGSEDDQISTPKEESRKTL
ncbi:hypothetical protein HGM15179_015574 [Zosterops borbonicus]|uniref:Uncharacterized protein n=1 Tax=Zosterops borbonicus TaxID=364589 RepID=A0A8K1G4J6_9PASS|nr:hypothetical protein HGM15179_015574 [Zosterops borbonicus]